MKTTMNKAFSLILAALLLLTGIPLPAQADTVFYDSASGLYFHVIGTNPNLVEVEPHPERSYSGSYVIPETVTYQGVTYTVTKIGNYAFKESDVTSVVVPNTVQGFGIEAFSQCTELISLNIPDSVTYLFVAAIHGTGLTSLTVPASVTDIADEAISYNAWADVLVLYDEPKHIGSDAFLETNRVVHKLVTPNSVNCSNFLSYWPLQIENNVDIAGFYHVKFCANNSAVLEFSIDRSTDSSGTGATAYTGQDMAASLAELGPGVYTVYAQAACDGYGASDWTKGNTFTYGTDTEAPIISNVKVNRMSAAKAIVEFTSSEKGVFYSAWANNSLDTVAEGKVVAEGANSVTVDLAAGNQAQDIQLMVKDYMGNESTVVIATAPEYVIPFTVDFDTNGYGTAPESQTVKLGDKVTQPADPVAEGYTFGGWYTDAACTTAWNFETDIVNEDMTLYARWMCTLTYDGNGYDIRTTPSDASGKTYQVGSSANVAQGYHPNSKLQFQSWNTKPDGSGTKYVINNSLPMIQNTTLYAQWKCRVGVVGSWANSGCEVSINSLGLSVDIGGSASFTVTLMNGWDKTEDFAVTANNIPLEPSEISADGRTMTYTMTNVRENQFLRLQGAVQVENYVVTYDANGGTGTVTDSKTYVSNYAAKVLDGSALTPPTGMAFDGWNTAADGSGTDYAAGSTLVIPGDITLYAQWAAQAGGYLTFQSDTAFTLKTANAGKNWNGTMEYSVDRKTWTTWTGGSIASADGVLYLRGTGNTKVTEKTGVGYYGFQLSGEEITCSGNVMTLLDYETVLAGQTPEMAQATFMYLFSGNAALVSAPELPATAVTTACYRGMFKNCTGLTVAPALPATELSAECYYEMFEGCTGLTEAPELKATLAPAYCYYDMFYKCTSLKTAPALPATELYTYCYGYMFYGCTSLEAAPDLPAQTLASFCYYYMFAHCDALTWLPEISAVAADEKSCMSMFSGCDGIKVSETETEDYPHAWKIPVTTEGSNWNYLFLNNTTGTFTGDPVANKTYYQYCYEKAGPYYIYGYSTSLASSLGLNIYIRESDLQEGDYLEVYKNNADGTATAAKKILCADMEQRTVNGVACRRYSYTGIAAKEMNDKLTCVVKNADGVAVSYTDNISIRDYAIDWAFDSVSDTEKTLFIDMLNYGAEAQLLFDYNTENLANAGLTAEQLAYGSGSLDVGDLNDYYVIPAEDTLLVGYSLTLVEKIQVNAYFHQDKIKALNEDTGKIHVKVSLTDYLGVEKTEDIPFADFIVRSSDGYDMYGVNVESLVAADLETGITLTLMNGEDVVGVYGYNVAAYCQDAVYGNYAEKDLAVALANYCKSAYNLFKN